MINKPLPCRAMTSCYTRPDRLKRALGGDHTASNEDDMFESATVGVDILFASPSGQVVDDAVDCRSLWWGALFELLPQLVSNKEALQLLRQKIISHLEDAGSS
jgi:hypothetical protein